MNLPKDIEEDIKKIKSERRIEVRHINEIYKEFGFHGVLDYAERQLEPYGAVKEVEKGLYRVSTGGWSDNEFFLSCLTSLTCMMVFKGHYCAYERGGAFYFTRKKHRKVKVILDD